MLVLIVFAIWLHTGNYVVHAEVAPSLEACEAAKAELTKQAAAHNDHPDIRCIVLKEGTPT